MGPVAGSSQARSGLVCIPNKSGPLRSRAPGSSGGGCGMGGAGWPHRTAECLSRRACKPPKLAVGVRGVGGGGAGGQPASEAPPSPTPRRGAVGVGLVSSHFWEVALTSCSSPQNLEIRLHFPNSQPGRVTSSAEKGGLRDQCSQGNTRGRFSHSLKVGYSLAAFRPSALLVG